MTAPRTYSIYVGHILEATEHACSFVTDMSFKEFAADRPTTYATVRALEIIDEATKRLPGEVRAASPNIPWSEPALMRDRIIHQYDRVDLAVVWDTVQSDLPQIVEPLETLQRDLERREDDEWHRLQAESPIVARDSDGDEHA